MRSVAMMGLAMIACGRKAEPKPQAGTPAERPKAERFAKVKQPKVSAVCEQARAVFGYGAECVETELPELTTAAGKLVRVVNPHDPLARWRYVLVRPDGTLDLGDGGRILDEVAAGLDLRAVAPATLAHLYATLDREVALVRCLPGTDDSLPADPTGKPRACAAPTLADQGGKLVLSVIVEQVPYPGLVNRDDHGIWAQRIEVLEHELSVLDGEGLVTLPAAAPRPSSHLLPARPRMTTPPDWVAAPVAASAEVGAALCAAASANRAGLAGWQCAAYAYPSLELPTGALYYLANDAGQPNVLALKRPDGTIATGWALETDAQPLKPILAAYDPAVVPPAKLLAAHLFLQGEPARILCLPGSGDVIPGAPCAAPAAEQKGEELIVTGIVEELALPDGHGSVSDPAVRAYSITFTPGGGSLGGGARLIDLRDDRGE